MNKDVLKLGLLLLQEGVEKNIFYLLDMTKDNRLKTEVYQATFHKWCLDNPVEFQYMDDNFVG